MKHKILRCLERLKPEGIQSLFMIVFSVISISLMLILGIVTYFRFSNFARQETIRSTQTLIEQTGENLEDYLVSMRQISDAAYYSVIKEHDFAREGEVIQNGMNLLYEANKDNLRSIAVYNDYGSLLLAEPVAAQKEDPNVTRQNWYKKAMEEMENMHFSTPHIQNLFDDAAFRYYWVISLSRVVELTENGNSRQGVLLVDMDNSGISRMMNQINTSNNGQYYYLCDSRGEIIYHPRQVQISDGISSESSKTAAGFKDGIYKEKFDRENRTILVNTISYTGWKLVGVIPDSAFTHGIINLRYFIILLMLLTGMMLMFVNRVVSDRISRPILKLNHSVKEYEAGEKPDIYVGGPLEIRHLSCSIQKSYEEIDRLMEKIVLEQTERRKSELDALQSQINPHFLYNALESITWMVEGERREEAVFMISQLARLFRISLSKGRTVISIRDELQHAESYMNIQKIRYKNKFSVEFAIDAQVYDFCAVKLILQPILENAVHYGVSPMEECGEIRITGKLQDSMIILSVEDNGMGMTEEEAGLVLTDSSRVHKHSSGVGLANVNSRIQLLFGKEYGLSIKSEPDEGTRVFICIPAVPFTEENRKILEKGHLFRKEEITEIMQKAKTHEEQ